MFTKSAKFYDALYHFKDYKAASDKLIQIINKYNPEARTLLDIACGTGKHIEHLNNKYESEGLDINDELLEIARRRCPANIFHSGNMTNFKLGKKFDVITCLFSSIAYIKYAGKLNSAVESMAAHLNNKGIIIIEPWFSKDTFWTGNLTANHFDEKDFKITWMYTSKIEKDLSVLDIQYLVGTPEEVTHFSERHELGLFSDSEYRQAFTNSDLEVNYDKEGLFGRGMYIGVKN